MIKKLIKNYQLRKSEREWRLYGGIVKTQINWEFTFIDQIITSGHFNSQIVLDKKKKVCNSVIVINLNKKIKEKVLFHTLNHEAIHVAICECILNQSSDFIETVIDDWIMRESVEGNGWKGNLYIKKRKK